MPRVRERFSAAWVGWRTGRQAWVYGVSRQRTPRRRTNRPQRSRADLWQQWTSLGSLVSVLLVALGLYLTNRATNEKLSIRIGAIHSLERLMLDSPNDGPAILDVLCTFVRTHAVRPTGRTASSPDVVAAFTAIALRPDDKIYLETPLNLRGAFISTPGSSLSDAELSNIESNLSVPSADLSYSNLSGSTFEGADFEGTHLENADLKQSSLVGANMRNAQMSETDLEYANLDRSDLSLANLAFAKIEGATFGGADLRGASLRGTDVTSDQLICAILDNETDLPAGVVRPDPEAFKKEPC